MNCCTTGAFRVCIGDGCLCLQGAASTPHLLCLDCQQLFQLQRQVRKHLDKVEQVQTRITASELLNMKKQLKIGVTSGSNQGDKRLNKGG